MQCFLVTALVLALLASVSWAEMGPEDEEYDTSHGVKLQFKGQSPQFDIQSPGNTSHVAIRLGSIYEAEPDGKKVPGRQVMSLAAVHPVYEQGNYTTVDGQNISFVVMRLPLASLNLSECDGGATNGFVNASTASTAGYISIKVYFGFTQQAVFPFGFNNTIAATANSTKFNIEAMSWPFCNASNSLVVELHLRTGAKQAHPKPVDELVSEANSTVAHPASRKLLSNAKAPANHQPDNKESGAEEGHGPRTPFGPEHNGPKDPRVADRPRMRFAMLAGDSAAAAAVAFNLLPYAYDAEDGTVLMNVTVASLEQGENTVFRLGFPAFQSLFYDPTAELVSATDAGYTTAEVTSYLTSPSPSPSSSSPAVKNAGHAHMRTAGMSLGAAVLLMLLLL